MGLEWVQREISAAGRLARRSLLDDLFSADEISVEVYRREVGILEAEEPGLVIPPTMVVEEL